MPDWSHCKLGASGLALLWPPRRAASALGALGSASRRAGRRGLPRPARGGEAPAAGVLGLWAAGMASSEPTCISREFWCLGAESGVCACQLSEPPGEGEADTGSAGPRCKGAAQGASPSREWAAGRGPPNFGGPRAARGARLLAASRRLCCPPLTFVNKAHPLPGLAYAPCPRPEPPPPTR